MTVSVLALIIGILGAALAIYAIARGISITTRKKDETLPDGTYDLTNLGSGTYELKKHG